MELPQNYSERFRPRARKIGEPRTGEEKIINDFLEKLNDDRKRDGVAAEFRRGRLLKAFKGMGEQELYILWQKCSAPAIEKFGGFLKYELQKMGRTL